MPNCRKGVINDRESLRRNGIHWRVACTCDRLNGVRAAVLAGLGVAVFAGSVLPDGLVPFAGRLPDPGAVVFALTSRRRVIDGPVAALAEVISSHHWAVGPQRTVQG